MPRHRIVKIAKPGWTIYYDCDAQYPVCVAETFAGALPRAPIKRADVGEPFRADTAVPKRYRMYWREYEAYMAHGGSPGHNAPAGFHKSSLADYRRTFLLSNICPQEMVFNGGRWLLLEALCRDIVAAFPRTAILTGSVPAPAETRFGDCRVNVPTHMYKFIAVTDAEGRKHAAAYLMPNEPATDEVSIDRFCVDTARLARVLDRAAGFDIMRIVGSVGAYAAGPLSRVHPLAPDLTDDLRALMRAARLNGRLVYSRTLAELDRVYASIDSPSKYHRRYRNAAARRIRAAAAGDRAKKG